MNVILKEFFLPDGKAIQIVQGDITTEIVDAIVNAANARLQHGAGVAWAISSRGGPAIQQESDAWVWAHGAVSHAHPAWTSGGLLPAKYVIHAVGPVWGEGDEDAKLSAAVTGCLHVADELKLKSISMPAISTGVFGFPKERAARIILDSVSEYFVKEPSTLQTVRLVLFDHVTVEAFIGAWKTGKSK